MITKLLTRIGDALGLVRDNKKTEQTDGISHLYQQSVVHLVVSAIVSSYFKNITALFIANWIVLGVMAVILIISEHRQEKDMVKLGKHDKYHWKKARYQDVLIPVVFWLLVCILLTFLNFK